VKIMMVTDFYAPLVGGVEVAVSALSHALAERGHDVDVATIRTGDLATVEEEGPVTIHRIPVSTSRLEALFTQPRPWAPPVPDPEAAVALRRLVRDVRPDIVHGHDWLARSFIPWKRGSGARFVMSLHYYTLKCAKKSLVYEGTPCSGPALVKCLRCAGAHYGRLKGSAVTVGNFAFAAAERRAVDLFLPVSSATAKGNGLDEGTTPFEVIPNFLPRSGRPTAEISSLLAQLPTNGFLLFVGDLRSEKGIDVLLEAYRTMAGATPLVLIGKTWPQSPKSFPPGVLVLRDWPNEAVREAQRRALALIAPSVWPEPFGMVVLEALAAGTPVVASGIGGIVDLVDHETSGLLVRPGDVASLSRALRQILADDDLRRKLGWGASRAATAFSEAAVVSRFEQAYEAAPRPSDP
jgi:glycosyltransferase involved in cell wall biosynthesis